MPYWLESDTFADDPVWEVLAGGNADRVDQLQAAYARLKAKASHILSDGYLTAETALRYARGRRHLLELLCRAVLDRPPLLHRPGDECDCLGEAPWVDGYAFRIHAFLRRNPSRSEYNRNRAQRADLRDPRLKTAVYARDAGCCRYCRSGPLSPKAGRSRDRRKVLTYDHVDPDHPAGPDGTGLVVACDRCNTHKGHRTPAEADMVLLPEPTIAQRVAWERRGLALYDPADHAPDQEQDHRRITDETATDHRHDGDPITDRTSDPNSDRDPDPNDDPGPPVRPDHDEHRDDQRAPWSGKGAGAGRGGDPAVPATDRRPEQPARPASAPDIYTRRSRAPDPPDYHWPPGAIPADLPRSEEPDP